MSVKIYTLIENEKEQSQDNNSLVNEFGLSFYIEDEDIESNKKFKFIFDTGQTGEFINNAKKMNIDLKKVNNIILSHSHYDHTGGLKTFIETVSRDFTLNIHKTFFEEKYKDLETEKKFLGNNFDKNYLDKKQIKINYITEDLIKISPNVSIHTNFECLNDFEKLQKFYIRKRKEEFIIDHMKDEIVLSINTSKGLVVLVACSHIGITNIIENIKKRENKKIYGIIGGLHLSQVDDERMETVINYFIKNDIKYFSICHCTGSKFIEKMKKLECFKEGKIFSNNTGKFERYVNLDYIKTKISIENKRKK